MERVQISCAIFSLFNKQVEQENHFFRRKLCADIQMRIHDVNALSILFCAVTAALIQITKTVFSLFY